MKDINKTQTLKVPTYKEGDVVIHITGITPGQRKVLEVELEISEFETLEEVQRTANDIQKLESAEDVFEYYSEDRGMDDDDANNMSLIFERA